jgi:NAD(P)-dependent dehydrogenase (short-subunit alcohol dehydrogenase family)
MGSLQVGPDKSTPFHATEFEAHGASKAAVNMLAINFARELDDRRAKVNAVCPGSVKTEATGFSEYGGM